MPGCGVELVREFARVGVSVLLLDDTGFLGTACCYSCVYSLMATATFTGRLQKRVLRLLLRE